MRVDLDSSRASIGYARAGTVQPPFNRIGAFAAILGAIAGACVVFGIVLGSNTLCMASLVFGIIGAAAGSVALFRGRERGSSIGPRRRGNWLGFLGILLAGAPLRAVA